MPTPLTEITLRPNPAQEFVNVPADDGILPVEIDVLDALGRLVERVRIPMGQPNYRLNVRHYATGVYSVRIGTRTLRFVKL